MTNNEYDKYGENDKISQKITNMRISKTTYHNRAYVSCDHDEGRIF